MTLIDDADTVYTIPTESSRIRKTAQPHHDSLPMHRKAISKRYNALKYFELAIENVEAAYKLSQNQSTENPQRRTERFGRPSRPGSRNNDTKHHAFCTESIT